MNYNLTIHCTKEHLKKASKCNSLAAGVSENCWIAVAVREIFPGCNVGRTCIVNESRVFNEIDIRAWSIELPEIATKNIDKFDATNPSSKERMTLEPFSFTVDIPQETLDIIMQCNGLKSMAEMNEIIFRTPHLELVEAPQMS